MATVLSESLNGVVKEKARKGFSRGAVLKLRLENFLTFDRVVIHPKPELNVMVGPNGTGKSSIVCAICLGLGGSTTILGRARDLKDFVKHGKDSGFVEITLYDDKAPTHPVIRRSLSATSNSSEWTINRRSEQEKNVKKLVESLNIQLDNRCMFLPQDKVIEFARMNKQELLVETERAVGPKELYQHHEELKSLKAMHSSSCTDLKKKQDLLQDLERRNNMLKRDVDRFQNREKLEKQIRNLTHKRSWVLYEDARHEYSIKKAELKEANDDLKSIKDHYQPIKERHNRQERAVERYKVAAQTAMKAVHQMENQLRDEQERLSGLEEKVEEPRQELENAKREEAARLRKIETLKREIEGFRRDLEELEPTESLTPKIAARNAGIRSVHQRISGLADQQREMAEERLQHQDILRKSEEQLQQMNNMWTQRLEKLRHRDPATVQVVKWLKGNQHMFRQPILEPVCMSLNVQDPRYVKQAESFFSGRDFCSFVAQNEEDRERFLKEVRDTMHLKVNIARAPDRTLKDFQPAIPFHTLQRFHFDKMLLDVVEAPEPVLCLFCQYSGLHNIPIAGNLRPQDVAQITTELPNLKSFYTASMRYSVKQSLYRKASSTRSMELFQPKFLVGSVDTQRREALEEDIRSCRNSLAQFEQRYQDLEAQDRELRGEDAKLRSEKGDLRKIVDTHKSHRANITSRESKLEKYLQTTFSLQQAEEKCEQEVNRIQTERVQCLGKLRELVRGAIGSTDESVKASLNVCTSQARVRFFLRQFREVKNTCDNAQQRCDTLTCETKEAKKKSELMLDKAVRLTGVRNPADHPDLEESFRFLPDNLNEIEEDLHEKKAKLEACVVTDQTVVDDFYERKEKIENLAKEILKRETDIGNRDSRIKELKEKWLGPLKSLIEEVNKCFRGYFSSHMGMEGAGKVALDPDPEEQPEFSEFDKFGVQINVKFRTEEALQELNAQRQSGGERSVSTMLYLMALQGTTSCPFRVVDEINQGMDPENERRIFNLIVQSASGAQYFLLTPKLLSHLEYSRAVSIHVVNNGQEMMSCEKWNLDNMLG